MHRAALALLAVVIAFPVVAQTLRQTLDMPPPGGIEVLSSGQLVMSSQICSTLGVDPGVPSADYQPGIDVNGRPVASADLPESPDPLKLDNFPIEIKADLAGKFGVPARGGAFGAKAILGYVTLRDNQAYFNGQPIGGDQREALIEACRRGRR
jgi:hypothetical protein